MNYDAFKSREQDITHTNQVSDLNQIACMIRRLSWWYIDIHINFLLFMFVTAFDRFIIHWYRFVSMGLTILTLVIIDLLQMNENFPINLYSINEISKWHWANIVFVSLIDFSPNLCRWFFIKLEVKTQNTGTIVLVKFNFI